MRRVNLRSQRIAVWRQLAALWSGWLGLWCGVVVAAPAGLRAQAPVSASTSAAPPQAYVVTLSGRLGPAELARCHRALRDAEAQGVGYVIFRCDQDTGSYTEDPGDLQSLFDHVLTSRVATVTLVRGRATQGAAYLALLTDRAYCMPGAWLGEIQKPEQDWLELLSRDPDGAMARRLEAARATLQSRLLQRKTPLRADAAKMALAMVDPRMQLVTATVREAGLERRAVLEIGEIAPLQAAGAQVLNQEKLTRPLMVDARTAEEAGLVQGIVGDLDTLCVDVLGCQRGAHAEVGDTWSEHMVGWLSMLQPFLLVAGLLLILLEVKTPGVGLPGVLGTLFLALALFHSYLVGLADVAEITVFFLGLTAIAVEIFLLPGTVVFGVVGFVCLVLALVLSQQSFAWPSSPAEEDILVGNLLRLLLQFVAVFVLAGLLWRLLPRLPWVRRSLLAEAPPVAAAAGAAADGSLTGLVGRTGVAATVLRPAGVLDLDGERVDVVTEGEFLPAGSRLRVLYVQGNRVVVGRVETGQSGNVGVVLLLALVGLCLLVAEVFFVSFGVIATLAGVALIGAVFLAFQEAMWFGVWVLVGEAVLSPVVLTLSFKLLPRTRLGKELILTGPATPAQVDAGLAELAGQRGVALTPLRPAGFARIAGRKVDVVTRGEPIDADRPVVVIEVHGSRVVVAEPAAKLPPSQS